LAPPDPFILRLSGQTKTKMPLSQHFTQFKTLAYVPAKAGPTLPF
jgi:hypothetical protein